MKIVLITGASSGIGQACAQHLASKDFCVYGTSRHAPALSELNASRAPSESANMHMIQMDVTSEESVTQGIQHILNREGQLDVVINNAGIGYAGAVEDTT